MKIEKLIFMSLHIILMLLGLFFCWLLYRTITQPQTTLTKDDMLLPCAADIAVSTTTLLTGFESIGVSTKSIRTDLGPAENALHGTVIISTTTWPIDDIQGEPRSWDFNYQPKVEPAIYHTQELNQDSVICSNCGAACRVERWRSAPESPPKKVIKSDEYDGTSSLVCMTLEMRYHIDHYNIQCTSCTYTRYFEKMVPGE